MGDPGTAGAAGAFARLVASRSSVRRFDRSRPVAWELIVRVLEAARLAPSAENAQPWRFVVVDSPPLRDELAKQCFSGIHAHTRRIDAPVFLVLCGVRGAVDRGAWLAQKVSYTQVDCGIAGEHVVLAAAEAGLGTCWIGWFNRRRARRLLGVPAGVDVVALIALGWPADAGKLLPRPRARKPMSAVAWRGRWNGPPVA